LPSLFARLCVPTYVIGRASEAALSIITISNMNVSSKMLYTKWF